MSNSTSPSLLNYLRQYRFQRKPSDTDSGPSSGSKMSMPSTSTSASGSSGPYKRIRLLEADSDDSITSPVKKIPATITIIPNELKERRFRNMTEMFPEISAQMVKSVLIKHNWNEERSRDELLKYDPEDDGLPGQSSSVGAYISRPIAVARTTAGSRPAFTNGFSDLRRFPQQQPSSRPAGGEPRFVVKKPLASRGGRTRRGSSDSEDSDYGVRKGRDDRVYDSSDSDNEQTNEIRGDKQKVFNFLNTAKMSELVTLSGCSQKKAEIIIGIRPFKSWLDLVEKFNSNKNISAELLNSTQELLHTRNNIQVLMKKCVGLAQQLETAVAAGSNLLTQPAILDPTLKLAGYQVIGLNWLSVLHKQGVSGILADEMGLGKTVQVIAFLGHLKETGQAQGTHLVVVPASTLDNWGKEFARWCPSMRVSMYYGNQEERRALRVQYAKGALRDIDVILTTYTMVHSCPEERKMFRVTPLHYVVYDEAHMLKNMASQRYDNLVKIKSKHRLLLTGTPLQNNLLELMSLLCFVMPHMFRGKENDLKSLFQKNSKSIKTKKTDEQKDEEKEVPLFEQSQIQQAKRIMKPFVLRRLKRDVLQELPPKTDILQQVPMAPSQQKLYKDLIDRFSSNDGTIHATNEQSGMSMMMELRRLANHPLLMRNYYGEAKLREMARRLARDPSHKETNEQYLYEDLLFMSDFQIHQLTTTYSSICKYGVPSELIACSGKFQWLDRELPRLHAARHRVLIFSQFTMVLDVLEPYLRLRGHRYLRLDGQTAVTLRQELIDQYNEEDIFVFLLSTRAGGLGINLTAADTVVIHDIDFNPYNDKQAEDRCHRMGQTKPVTIYRLVSAGTIEEGIYQVAQEKLSLERDITNTDAEDAHEQKNVVRLLSVALGLAGTK